MDTDDEPTYQIFLIDPGPRPPFFEVADYLWDGQDVDTDGDSWCREATDWTELYIAPRPANDPIIEIAPWDDEDPQRVLCISSNDEALMRRAAEYLAECTGGSLSAEPPELA